MKTAIWLALGVLSVSGTYAIAKSDSGAISISDVAVLQSDGNTVFPYVVARNSGEMVLLPRVHVVVSENCRKSIYTRPSKTSPKQIDLMCDLNGDSAHPVVLGTSVLEMRDDYSGDLATFFHYAPAVTLRSVAPNSFVMNVAQ